MGAVTSRKLGMEKAVEHLDREAARRTRAAARRASRPVREDAQAGTEVSTSSMLDEDEDDKPTTKVTHLMSSKNAIEAEKQAKASGNIQLEEMNENVLDRMKSFDPLPQHLMQGTAPSAPGERFGGRNFASDFREYNVAEQSTSNAPSNSRFAGQDEANFRPLPSDRTSRVVQFGAFSETKPGTLTKSQMLAFFDKAANLVLKNPASTHIDGTSEDGVRNNVASVLLVASPAKDIPQEDIEALAEEFQLDVDVACKLIDNVGHPQLTSSLSQTIADTNIQSASPGASKGANKATDFPIASFAFHRS